MATSDCDETGGWLDVVPVREDTAIRIRTQRCAATVCYGCVWAVAFNLRT